MNSELFKQAMGFTRLDNNSSSSSSNKQQLLAQLDFVTSWAAML
jgi:hypothetical protein